MYYIDAVGDNDKFSSNMPIIGWMRDTCTSLDTMMEYLEDDDNIPEASHLNIHALHPNGITSEWFVMAGSYQPLQGYLRAYAMRNKTTVKSFRLKYNDRTIFLSSIRDKTPRQLGMTGGTLEVTFIQSTAEEEQSSKPKSQPSNKKSKGKKKKHKRSNKKKAMRLASFENEEEKLKEQHSQSLSRVFEEADATFRSIRQKLEAMNLERTLPKEKRSRPKPKVVSAEPLDNPVSDGLAGKAGKTHFIVQVGETNNLYNTRGSKQSAGRIAREVDARKRKLWQNSTSASQNGWIPQ